MSTARSSRVRLSVWAIAPACLLLHGIVATCLPERWAPLSTFCIVLAELAALIAVVRASRNVDHSARILWRLLACSILFHATAMSLDAINEIAQATVFNFVPAFSIYFSMLYGVPLLVAVSMQSDRRTVGIARTISAILSLAIGAVLYVQIFTLLTVRGSSNPADALLIMYLFDGFDLFLAAFATIRWLASSRAQERRFFHILSIFLWLNAVLPAVHNRVLLKHDYVWLDLLISAPYLLLLVLILTVEQRSTQPPPALVRAVRSGSPIFLTLALVFEGMFASRSHFYIGMTAVLLAIAAYGALNVLTYSRVLESEESLLAVNVHLEKLVDVDALTGIANRRAFDKVLNREFSATRRTTRPLSVLMIDVDHFKQVNDVKGHDTGDQYLIRIAGALRVALPREIDFVARYGGEEFAVILPATDSGGAARVAAKLRQSIANLGLSHPAASSGKTTVSIGFTTFDGSAGQSPSSIMRTADRALYRAKKQGRNRSEFLPQEGTRV